MVTTVKYIPAGDGAAPQKVQIEIIRDDRPGYSPPDLYQRSPPRQPFRRTASKWHSSPVAKCCHFGRLCHNHKQITHTPAGESGLLFSHLDNRTLAYASERNGNSAVVSCQNSPQGRPQLPERHHCRRRGIVAVSHR